MDKHHSHKGEHHVFAGAIGPVRSLTHDELTSYTGEKPETLTAWREAGIIGSVSDDNFTTNDVGRARLVHEDQRRTISRALVRNRGPVARANRRQGGGRRRLHGHVPFARPFRRSPAATREGSDAEKQG